MRLFTGIALPSRVTANLDKLIRALRPAADIRWSVARNLHITTKFIGEWSEERLEELRAVLGDIPPTGEVQISVRGLGWFPNERAPRVFWAGVEAAPGLAELASQTEQRLAELGVPKESRKYSPHLTLARIKGPVNLQPLKRAIEALPSTDFGTFTTDRFHLYLSERSPNGSVYTSLEEYELSRE